MKGYLKSAEGVFQLAPKVTTIGREGCDLSIQSNEVDFQHAVIEYSTQEECFVLQDLNTINGTYINECRVQNAAVRLAPGDIIRFGCSNTAYELDIESSQQYAINGPQPKEFTLMPSSVTDPPTQPQPPSAVLTRREQELARMMVAYPPVHQRGVWTQPLTVIGEPSPVFLTSTTLPHLKHLVNTSTQAWQQPADTSPPVPRPPSSIRSRPLSAGATANRRPGFERSFMERTQSSSGDRVSAFERTTNSGLNGNLTYRKEGASREVGGWVSGPSRERLQQQQQQQTADIALLQEKEQRILRLTEELKRVPGLEQEVGRKEQMIAQLRSEIQDLHSRLRQVEMTSSYSENDISQKLLTLEADVQLKKLEIQSLKEQINLVRQEESVGGGQISRQEFNDRILEMNSLRVELERVKKDKNITTGLVSTMQRDMCNKDTTISRLTREVENMRKECHEKEVQISSYQAKYRRTQETKKTEEENDNRDRELASLRLKTKSSESRIQEQHDLIASLKEEMSRVKSQMASTAETQKKLQSEVDTTKATSQDFERAERLVRIDLEQLSKRMERFKGRVLQTTFSTPGIKAPDKELGEDELIEALKKIIDERTEFTKRMNDMKQNKHLSDKSHRDMTESSRKMKTQLIESVDRLKERGMLVGRLRQETDQVAAVTMDEGMVWMRESIISLLTAQLEWEGSIEAALEHGGINVKLSDESPATHIQTLCEGTAEARAGQDTLRQRLEEMEGNHRSDLEATLEAQKADLYQQHMDEVERLIAQHNEKLELAIREVQLAEEEKTEVAITNEQGRISELEASIESLKLSLLKQEEDQTCHKEEARSAVEELEAAKKVAEDLQAVVADLEKKTKEEVERLTSELQAKIVGRTSDEQSYKEQIRQHSVTICAMEERLNKVMKRNKDYQAEITQLRANVTELKSRPKALPPPKPKVIVQKPPADGLLMEQTIVQLQREVGEYRRQVTEQQDVISALRRDLSGASARMSDMKGELSETQKEKMEGDVETIRRQETELVALRQQLARLSEVVDKQNIDTKALEAEFSKSKSTLTKFRSATGERDTRVRELEELLKEAQETSRKNHELIEEEGRITSELSAMGAQCRGERHDQVINRQREALTELRARIKTLEQTRPPLPTHDAALQQVVMLKKELAEIRTAQALADGGSGLSSLDAQVSRARGLDPKSTAEAEHERSAHRETMESLEMSESSFLSLLRAVASSLEMEEVGGLRSIAHIPHDERLRLSSERCHAVELLTNRIKVLQERIVRKDELLQGYERDLAKLRQAEMLAETKHTQVECLTTDMRSKNEESQLLRETLQRTKDKLDQEKRLNTAIKQKKTFHLEPNGSAKNSWPKHQCPPDDVMDSNAARKRANVEKFKRKNYEIKTLKSELTSREKDLSDARRRMVTMETSMGMELNRDPLEPPVLLEA